MYFRDAIPIYVVHGHSGEDGVHVLSAVEVVIKELQGLVLEEPLVKTDVPGPKGNNEIVKHTHVQVICKNSDLTNHMCRSLTCFQN